MWVSIVQSIEGTGGPKMQRVGGKEPLFLSCDILFFLPLGVEVPGLEPSDSGIASALPSSFTSVADHPQGVGL